MEQRKVIGKRAIGSGKWIKLVELDYASTNEKILKWEMVERTTKTTNGIDGNEIKISKSFNTIQGVDIIAILDTKPIKQVVLVSQFRPPLDAHCIEFPAGLITGEEETPVTAAMRELYVTKTLSYLLILVLYRKRRVITVMKPK